MEKEELVRRLLIQQQEQLQRAITANENTQATLSLLRPEVQAARDLHQPQNKRAPQGYSIRQTN
jgi:hypothetical protein